MLFKQHPGIKLFVPNTYQESLPKLISAYLG